MYNFLHSAFDQVLRLTPAEIGNPSEVIDDFLFEYPLSKVRQHLWQLVETALLSDDEFNDPDVREDLLLFHDHLEAFIEAVALQSGKVKAQPEQEGPEQAQEPDHGSGSEPEGEPDPDQEEDDPQQHGGVHVCIVTRPQVPHDYAPGSALTNLLRAILRTL